MLVRTDRRFQTEYADATREDDGWSEIKIHMEMLCRYAHEADMIDFILQTLIYDVCPQISTGVEKFFTKETVLGLQVLSIALMVKKESTSYIPVQLKTIT